MHLFRYAGGASPNGHPTALGIVSGLGLATNLKLCLDAGDANSYAGGASWLDTAGSGYDFFRGTISGADARDPTFNGTSGKRTSSEYFSSDGGDCFTYDTTNETWMENMHKSNALYTIAIWYYLQTTGTTHYILGQTAGLTTDIGVGFFVNAAANAPRVQIQNGGGGAVAMDHNPGAGLAFTAGWNFVAHSLDEANAVDGSKLVMNSNTATQSGAITSPSASNASYTTHIGASGAATGPMVNTERIGMVWIWEGTSLSLANLSSIYTASRTRYGV